MRPSGGERLCQEARAYYYDLLCQEEAAVPALVRHHVSTCPACQEEMGRLREALLESQRPAGAAAWQDETIESLAQQFQLLDERVTCFEAKPRLPELALASPQIRIPTPVTVHVDHCPQCAEDLAAIRKLHLTPAQLKRLGRLLGTGRGARLPRVEDTLRLNCGRPARDSGGGPAPAVPRPLSGKDADLACDELATADLFDCVVPSDATPPVGKAARDRQKAIARHVRGCPACLENVRTLQRTLGEILARANSEIVTVYHAENDAGEVEGEYPYPVSVQVLHGESEAAADAPAAPATSATCLRRRSAKPLAALAALVLIGIALSLLVRTTTPTASGTNIDDVDKTLANVRNIHIVVRDRQAKLVQEFWIDRRSGVLVKRTGDECVLYDLALERKRTRASQTGPGAFEKLDEDASNWARQFMASCLRDLVTGVSPDARLRPAEGGISSKADRGLDVYELPLSPRARSSPLRDRRLLYLDRATERPQRMELYRPVRGADPEAPATTTIFTYPTRPEMDTVIDALFPAR